MTSGEDYNLIILVCFLEAFYSIRSNVDSCLNSFSIWESHINHMITRIILNIIDAMNQGFVQVKNYGFLNYRLKYKWRNIVYNWDFWMVEVSHS